MFYYGQRSKCADLLNSYFRVYIISNVLIYSKRLLCVLKKIWAHLLITKVTRMRYAVFRLLFRKNQNCRSGIIQSVLFYPQNKLYPTIISAAAVITRKKVVGNIKAQVIPKPTQNSMRPHNRFILILPKRNFYDRLCGLKSNDSQI